jgi:hypothetical protein
MPQIAADGAGQAVTVWASNGVLGGTVGPDSDILVSQSADDGATWTEPAALNTNATTDIGNDKEPAIATDRAGNLVAAWGSNDTLGGTITMTATSSRRILRSLDASALAVRRRLPAEPAARAPRQ